MILQVILFLLGISSLRTISAAETTVTVTSDAPLISDAVTSKSSDINSLADGHAFTPENLKSTFETISKTVPDVFNPFSRSLLESFMKESENNDPESPTAKFFNFLFSRNTKITQFQPDNAGFWEALLISNLILFGEVDSENCKKLVESVVIPGYSFLNHNNYSLKITDAIDQGNYIDILNILDEESVKGFTEEYEKILQEDVSEVEKHGKLRFLLLKAREEIGFSTRHGKYHMAFLMDLPLNVLSKLKPTGDHFDECFAKMAEKAYNEMFLTVEGTDEAELILSSILPTIYDDIPDSMNYKQVIDKFVESENEMICNFDEKTVMPLFKKVFSRKTGNEFLFKFMNKYLPIKITTKFEIDGTLDGDVFVTYVGIKRLQKLYPNFVKEEYDGTLNECITFLKKGLDCRCNGKIIYGVISNGFFEISEFPDYYTENYKIYFDPFYAKNAITRKILKMGKQLEYHGPCLIRLMVEFMKKGQFRILDFWCRQRILTDTSFRSAFLDALIEGYQFYSFDHFLTKDYMTVETISYLIEFKHSSYGIPYKKKIFAELFDHLIRFHENRGLTIDRETRLSTLLSLCLSGNLEIFTQLLDGKHNFFDTFSFINQFVMIIIRTIYGNNFDVIKQVIDKFGWKNINFDHIFSFAVFENRDDIIDFFKKSYPQIFEDRKIIKSFFQNAFEKYRYRKSSYEKEFDFIYNNCPIDIFTECINDARASFYLHHHSYKKESFDQEIRSRYPSLKFDGSVPLRRKY